eukprot:Filipodium_phascolosomae@DN1327_c0_g1_i1.p1
MRQQKKKKLVDIFVIAYNIARFIGYLVLIGFVATWLVNIDSQAMTCSTWLFNSTVVFLVAHATAIGFGLSGVCLYSAIFLFKSINRRRQREDGETEHLETE